MDDFSDRSVCYSDDDDDDDDDDDGDSFDEEDGHLGEYEKWQKECEKNRRLNEILEKDERYMEQWLLAYSAYTERLNLLQHYDIRAKNKLQDALKASKDSSNRVRMGVFAHDRPIKNSSNGKIKFVKQYLVGMYSQFYHYACDFNKKVMLDECFVCFFRQPLHFDVEIKQSKAVIGTDEFWFKVLKSHMSIMEILPHYSFDVEDDEISQIYSDYRTCSGSVFTEEECKVGLKVLQDFIIEFVLDTVERCDKLDLRAVSGCREEKFSVHLVAKDLFVDSTVQAMPVFVYELARHFQVRNLDSIVRHYQGLEVLTCEKELSFRLRSLMITSLVTIEDDAPNGYYFRSMDDTPFDESIYTPNHLLRAPGACKPTTSALHPVSLDDIGVIMISENDKFDSIFPSNTDDGIEKWKANVISCEERGLEVEKIICLTNMRPTKAYPKERQWLTYSNKPDIMDSISKIEKNIAVSYKATLNFIRFEDNRHNRRPRQALTGRDRLYLSSGLNQENIADAEFFVLPDDKFLSEDGTRKPFRLFVADEWLHHYHTGLEEEKDPSARVFPGGYRCFVCQKTFLVPRERAFEELYEFHGGEIVTSDNPADWLPDIDWEKALEKKFIVIESPMGSGKTEQLARLLNILDAKQCYPRVLLVSFRQLLARQQARRLKIHCYLDTLVGVQLDLGPDMLTICLNSLLKLGGCPYDYVILDECGLIRRHFMSSTVKLFLDQLYIKFKQYINNAQHVIMLQEGITSEDVKFYTEMVNVDHLDRQMIYATCFKKPIVIHPISMTSDFHAAVVNLLSCYRESLTNGICEHPFMVFCNSCVYAEFLVRLLKEVAVEENADSEKIKGIWAQIKYTDPFCNRFAIDPNLTAREADVVVCTSVIGAGFSINRHFEALHAFFSTNIIPFQEEVQFIQRLRYVLQDVPETACRQSYLYVQKGRGSAQDFNRVKVNFEIVRRILIHGDIGRQREFRQASVIDALAVTEARVETERAAGRANHEKLWLEYGRRALASEFKEIVMTFSEEDLKLVQSSLKKFKDSRKKDLTSWILNDGEDGDVSQVELNMSYDLYRLSECDLVTETLEKAFSGFFDVIKEFIKVYLMKEAKRTGGDDFKYSPVLLRGKDKMFIARVHSLIKWLQFCFELLLPNRDTQIAVHHYHLSRINFPVGLQRAGTLYLFKYMMIPLFGSVEMDDDDNSRAGYLVSAGYAHFFNDCRYKVNKHLALAVKNLFEDCDRDSDIVKERKHNLRKCYQVSINKSQFSERCLFSVLTQKVLGQFSKLKMYITPETCSYTFAFFKILNSVCSKSYYSMY